VSVSSSAIETPEAGIYQIDPEGSSIAVTTKHMFGMATVTGKFALVSGQIVITEPVSSSHVEAAASAHSFDSASSMRDGQVKSAKFLDAEAHPEIRFTSTELVRDGDRWLLRGKITARGTAAPVELTVVELAADTTGLTLRATGRVDRRGSRRPGRAGTAARSGRPGAAPGRCPRRAGSRRRWMAR
jgi:polyisoprenoid-binding protein YceI